MEAICDLCNSFIRVNKEESKTESCNMKEPHKRAMSQLEHEISKTDEIKTGLAD